MDDEGGVFRALHDVAVATSGVLDPGTLASLVAVHAGHLIGTDSVLLCVRDGDAGALQMLHNDDPAARGSDLIPFGQGAGGMAMDLREVVLVEDYEHWEHAVPWAVERGIRSVLAIPLMVADRAVGMMVARFYEPRTFTDGDVNGFRLVAAQLAPALEAARLYQQTQREIERRSLLLRAARRLAAEPDSAAMLSALIDEAVALFDCTWGLVRRYDEANQLLVPLPNNLTATMAYSARPAGEGLSGRAAILRRPVLLDEFDREPPKDMHAEILPAVAVPLLHEGRLLGVFSIGSRGTTPIRLSPPDVEMLEVLAGIAAAALVGQERSRLQGALLAVRTAENELNAQLAHARGCAEILVGQQGLTARQQAMAKEALDGVCAATNSVARLRAITRLEEKQWGPMTSPTVDLDRSVNG